MTPIVLILAAAAGVLIGRIVFKLVLLARRLPDGIQDRYPDVPERLLGRCGRCQRSWKWVVGHPTQFSSDSAMFPLCQCCWSELTPQARLPYYRQLLDTWEKDSPIGRYDWKAIEAAVLQGK